MNLVFCFGPKLWFWTWTKLNNNVKYVLYIFITFYILSLGVVASLLYINNDPILIDVPATLLEITVPTEFIGTTIIETFPIIIIDGLVVPTIFAGQAAPTAIVLMAFYWKSCTPYPLVEFASYSSVKKWVISSERNLFFVLTNILVM